MDFQWSRRMAVALWILTAGVVAILLKQIGVSSL